jgi:RNA polymerase sigma factor (sigma-70 family)
MPTPLTTAVRRLRTLAAPATDDLPDRDLVARFRASADEAAFAALVARHGPAVLGVCRRVLSDPHAAEDAFQATFLTLARRAGGVRNPSAVGCWLHGVAFRVASKLRGRLARLPRTGDVPEVPTPGDDVSWREVRRVLDEEVTRLPDRLRLPVLLCYFEGKTRDEAAEALGCKVTTLRGRLEDGRDRLRTRLARRGVELSAALLAVSTAADAPAVDEALVQSTVSAACGVAGSGVATAARLALLVVLALGLGSTLILSPGQGKQAPAPETPKADPPPKAADPPKPPEWGEPSGDFRLRLRAPSPVKVGEGPELVTELKFAGKGGRFIPRSPEMLEVEVNGLWYRVAGGFTTEAEQLAPESELAPWLTARLTTAWVHLRDRPGADADAPQEAVPLRLAPGKHTVRVAYRFTRTERAVSNAVTLEVQPDGWGEAVTGIKARVRLAKTKFKVGEPLTFELDLKNVGSTARTFNPIPFACRVELDGESYVHHNEFGHKSVPKEIAAGAEVVPFVTVAAADGWRTHRRSDDIPGPERQFDVIPLKLTPGKHVVRAWFPIGYPMVGSQQVTIEVEAPALDPKLAALARSADRIWVVPSPTRDKPVPAPVRVLKGPPGRPEVFDLRLLPADDPKKQWIVFLQAQEEDIGVPAVKLLAGPTWSVPFDDGTAAAIGEALMPATWGETAGGLQMGLRFRDPSVALGSPIIVEVVIRNPGPADQTLEQHRMSIYDYWPGTTFQVTAPGGGVWTLQRPVGPMDEADTPLNATLKPGEAYVHAVRIDRWQAVWAGPQWRTVPPRRDLFADPGEYSVAGLYVQPKSRIRAWAGSLATKPVKLTVTGPKDDWGPAADGIQARVRTPNPVLPGRPLEFVLDVWNRTANRFDEAPDPRRCEIEWDGVPYRNQIGPPLSPWGPVPVRPNSQIDGWLRVFRGDGDWARVQPKPGVLTSMPEVVPLTLTPGKHALRVTYRPKAAGAKPLVSQTLAVVIEPADWGPEVDGVQTRVRVTKPAVAREPLEFALDVRNRGTRDHTEAPVPYDCEIHYNGKTYTYFGPIDYKATSKTVKPGGQLDGWTTVTTDQFWRSVGAKSEVLTLSPGQLSLQVTYPMRGSHRGKIDSQLAPLDVRENDWGPIADGIQARVRVTKPPVAGEPLEFALDLRNRGTTDFVEAPVPFECEVEYHDDVYTFSGPIDYRATPRTIKPGGQIDGWATVKADRSWTRAQFRTMPLTLTPGKHRFRVAYQMTGPNKMKVVSQWAEFEVRDGDWGPPVEGIQARVRVTNAKPIAGDPLTFELDLRNRGTKDFVEAPIPFFCQIELDGWLYKYTAPIGYPTGNITIKPDGQVDGWTKVKTDDQWAGPNKGFGWSGPTPPDFKKLAAQTTPLYLTPGKHKLRVSYPLTGANKFKVVSQETEFVVARSEWSGPTEGIRARVRPAKAKFREGEPLAFALDLKNEGTKDLVEAPVPMSCEIELDGRLFQYTGPISYTGKVVTLKPNMQIDGWTSVTTDPWWKQITGVKDAIPLALTPGRHTLRVWYQMTTPNKMKVHSQDAEFEVEPVLVPTADRIVVATFDGRDTMGLKPVKTLKGPHNTWQPDVQRVAIPDGSNTLPSDGWDREWLVFLRADEDGREAPKLAAGAVDWIKPATPAAVQAVRDLLKPPTETGPAVNGLTLGLRRSGDGVRIEVVLTNRAKEPARVLQHRFNVYDYWPFLTFTVTGPDGKAVTLSKPTAAFSREDYIGEQVLEPGESYVHAVRLDQWPDPRKRNEDLGPLFQSPGRYTVKATYAVPGEFRNRHPKAAPDDVHWAGELVSNELTVELGLSGKERLADFKANADSLHLTLTRRPRPGAAPPAERPLRYVHFDMKPFEHGPHATYPDGKPVGADKRIVAGEAEKLLTLLAADGFFDRAAPQAAETTEGDFLLEVWHEGASRGRLRLAYPWTEDTVRQLTQLAGCLFGGHPDLVKDVLSPVADAVPPWGEAVEGVACRARNVRAEGKAILLDLDVWNRGKETWGLTADASFADLEVDGVWYVPRYDRPIDVLSMIFKPGRRTDRPIPISTATGWKEKDPPRGREPKLLAVEPGKHKVRAAFEVSRAGKTLRVVSNLAEVEVPK